MRCHHWIAGFTYSSICFFSTLGTWRFSRIFQQFFLKKKAKSSQQQAILFRLFNSRDFDSYSFASNLRKGKNRKVCTMGKVYGVVCPPIVSRNIYKQTGKMGRSLECLPSLDSKLILMAFSSLGIQAAIHYSIWTFPVKCQLQIWAKSQLYSVNMPIID